MSRGLTYTMGKQCGFSYDDNISDWTDDGCSEQCELTWRQSAMGG